MPHPPDDDSEIPDYIADEPPPRAGASSVVVGVDASHVRVDVAEPPPRSTPDPSGPPREPAPPLQGPPSPEVRSAPPDEAPRGAAATILQILSVVVGTGLAIGTAVVVVALVIFTVVGVRLVGAAQTATEARSHLHTVLLDRSVLDGLEGSAVDPTPLNELYLDWFEADREPDRVRAAVAFLDAVDALSADDALPEASEGHLRRLHAARHRYEQDLALWDQRAKGMGGRVVIFIGAARPPPEAAD